MEGITIAVPALDMYRLSLTRCMMETRFPPGVEVVWKQQTHALAVDRARNNIVLSFRQQEVPTDRLWMVDDDMLWHPDSLLRLYERDLDIVAALTWTCNVPPMPTIWTQEKEEVGQFYYLAQVRETIKWLAEHPHKISSNDPVVLPRMEDDLVEVQATGAAFILIKRRVLETLEPPWFEGKDARGFGEDFAFCRKARAAGFKVYVDRSVIVTHYPRFPLGPLTFAAFFTLAKEVSSEEKALLFRKRKGDKK